MTDPVEPVDEHPADIDLVAFADGELDVVASDSVRHHVDVCARCEAVLRNLDVDTAIDAAPVLDVQLPFALAELFATVATDDPAPGDLWRAEWDATALLVVVLDEIDDAYRVAPVTFEEPDIPVAPAVPVEESPFGAPLYVWRRLADVVPLGVFLAPVGILAVESISAPAAVAGYDAGTALQMAHLTARMSRLVDADRLEATVDAVDTVPLSALLRGFKASELRDATGLPLPTITSFKRDERRPRAPEAMALASVLGVSPEALLGPVALPEALIRAVQRPVHRAAIRVRAAIERVSEAAMRLLVAENVAVLPARTTHGDRDVAAWDELIAQYLDE